MRFRQMRNGPVRLGRLFEQAAARHPANLIILDHDLDIAPELGRRATIGELASLVDHIASSLRLAGVRPDERVVVYKSESLDIVLIADAVARLGGVPVLLSSRLASDTVAALLRRARCRFLVTDQTKADSSIPPDVLTEVEHVLLTSGSHPGTKPLALSRRSARVAAVDRGPHSPILVTHTSGTTGTPKLVVHTGAALKARYRAHALSLSLLVPSRETVAIQLSYSHSRMISALSVALLRGCPVLSLADDSPATIAPLFHQLRPGIVDAQPNTFLSWESLADDPGRPFSNVRHFSSTFDAIHPRTVRRLLRASVRCAPHFYQAYGQTETGPALWRVFTRRHLFGQDGRCVGIPFFGATAVRVVSRNGRPASADSPGHIEVRCDGGSTTYLGEKRRFDQQLLPAGWWRMGDVGYRTRWGCVHLLDREVDVIEGLDSTLQIEDKLLSELDFLSEVVIVKGTDGVAVPVVCTHGDIPLDTTAWQDATASLPAMAPPVHWHAEDLPTTATMKVKRRELANLLAQRHTEPNAEATS